jgi:hypothetical protein
MQPITIYDVVDKYEPRDIRDYIECLVLDGFFQLQPDPEPGEKILKITLEVKVEEI